MPFFCRLTAISLQFMWRIREARHVDMQSLNLTDTHKRLAPQNTTLNCHSYQLCYILLICLIFDMKRLTAGVRQNGGGGTRGNEQALLSAACERSYNMNTQRGKHCLSLSAPLVPFISAPVAPSIPHTPLALDMHVGRAHRGWKENNYVSQS